MDDALMAIADPRRQEIMRVIGAGELTAGQVAERFAVTRQAVSHHLRVLREAGLLTERRDGTRRLYRVRAERIAELSTFLDSFWPSGLERLKASAEDEHRRRSRGAERN